jgi:hypothetical protein
VQNRLVDHPLFNTLRMIIETTSPAREGITVISRFCKEILNEGMDDYVHKILHILESGGMLGFMTYISFF